MVCVWPFYKTLDGQSYRLMLLSSDTDTTLLLSGLYFTPHTWSLCSLNVCTHFLSAKSHIFTLLSLDDDAKCFPSSENDTLSTQDAWPDSVPATSECALKWWIIFFVNINILCIYMNSTHTSYSFIWPSSEAVSSICESGEKQRLRTDIAWPSSVCATLPAATSNIFIIPSIAPLAMYFPSGLFKKLKKINDCFLFPQ